MNVKNKPFPKRPASTPGAAAGTPGGTSLMVIFAVLCLTVFAIMALSTVLADKRLSDAYAAGVEAHYAAEAEAHKTVAALRAGELPDGVAEDGGEYIFSVPVSDTKTLFVKAQLEGNKCVSFITTEAYTAGWSPDDRLELWTAD